MENFKIQIWHYLAVFGTVFIGVFKADLQAFFNDFFLLKALDKNRGREMEIASSSGEWEKVILNKVIVGIPFFKRSVVVVTHISEDQEFVEKFSIVNWRNQRTRLFSKGE